MVGNRTKFILSEYGEVNMAKEVRRANMDDIVKIMLLLSSVAQLHGDNRKDIFRNPT